MARQPKSISAKEISAAVKAAVKNSATLKDLKVDASIASIRDPINGFFPRDIDIKTATLGELNKVASSVAESLSSGKGIPTTLIHDGHILMGYVEDSSFTVLKE